MIVYKLTSPSSKVYIGQTKQSLGIRWHQHITLWNQYKKQNKPYIGCSTKLFYAFDKHDPSLWQQEILSTCNDHTELNLTEIQLIKEYNSIDNGYNITKGGSGRKVDYLTDEHKQKISSSRKKYFQTDNGIEWRNTLKEKYTGDSNPSFKKRGMPGRVQSEAEKAAKSVKMKELHATGYYKQFDYTKSEETKRKISENKKANPYKFSEEQLRNRSEKLKSKNIKRTAEHKQRNREKMEHQHLITYEDGKQEQFGSVKAYAEKIKIPFETLRMCLYKKIPSKKYNIQSIIKLYRRTVVANIM